MEEIQALETSAETWQVFEEKLASVLKYAAQLRSFFPDYFKTVDPDNLLSSLEPQIWDYLINQSG